MALAERNQPRPAHPAVLQSAAASPRRQGHGWRVIHACEQARHVLPVVEGQLAAGMRPYIVTPRGFGAAEQYLTKADAERAQPISLLRAWQDVRNWRRSLMQCDLDAAAELVHAHSFAAGMAAVRGCPVVVYDLEAFVEEVALAAGQCQEGSWLGRSFRVAEQFVCGRAAALVVHSLAMRRAAIERGAKPEDTFFIPAPLDLHLGQADADPEWRLRTLGGDRRAVVFFAPDHGVARDCRELPAETLRLLEAFAILRGEVEESRLLLASDSPLLAQKIARQGMGDAVIQVPPRDHQQALAGADVVIAGIGPAAAPLRPQSNPSAITALANRRPLLAAHHDSNRDVSPDGRGCLWFRQDDARDLAYRAAFLARNPDFRRTLAAAGHQYLAQSRSPETVGEKYDAVYRHAVAGRKSGPLNPSLPRLQPIPACL